MRSKKASGAPGFSLEESRDNNRATNCHLISKPLLPPSLTLECVYNRSNRSQFSFVVTCEGGFNIVTPRSSKRRRAKRRKWSGHAW